jgi:cardiolipin synthase (CMP-forming)
MLLVPFFFTELVSYQPGKEHHLYIALGIFVAAVFTDALDGFLARIMKSKTELGTFLDPLADKLLLVAGYLALLFVSGLPYRPPLWITVTIVFRDIMICLALLIIFLITGKIRVQPNFLGKCTTASQMATLIAILVKWPYSYVLWNITAALTIASFFVYFRREHSRLKTLE